MTMASLQADHHEPDLVINAGACCSSTPPSNEEEPPPVRDADARDGCKLLDAEVNILNRSFVGRKLEHDLGTYFVLARSMVQAKR